MQKGKRQRLERAGWAVGDTAEFLKLTPAEATYLELRFHLGEYLRERRVARKMSQVTVARLLESSQSRVAKMEAGDPSVSLDLLIKALLELGASRKELARAISHQSAA
jgi:predicted XRE-type DNA-binding protein